MLQLIIIVCYSLAVSQAAVPLAGTGHCGEQPALRQAVNTSATAAMNADGVNDTDMLNRMLPITKFARAASVRLCLQS
jgi:hypothetical protein